MPFCYRIPPLHRAARQRTWAAMTVLSRLKHDEARTDDAELPGREHGRLCVLCGACHDSAEVMHGR
jgi:hypothetical protein